MFRAPLCPSSGARKYYTDDRCLWYLVLWFSSCRYGVELRVMCSVCGLLQQPANRTSSNHLYNTLELLMMGIVVPEICWASNKICNKNHLLHLVGILFPHTIVSYTNLATHTRSTLLISSLLLHFHLQWSIIRLLRIVMKNALALSCPSVRTYQHGCQCETFLETLYWGLFIKIGRVGQNFVKIGQKYRTLYMKT